MVQISLPEKEISKWMSILVKLGIYGLDESQSIDLSPLEKLSELRKLELYKSYTFSIKSIKRLKNLQVLNLSGTPVSNLNPIKNMKNLKQLDITSTKVSNLEPLKGLTNLKVLYIQLCDNISDEQIKELHEALPDLRIQRALGK